jgi:REP element-mobilizing transposase RayT
MSENYKIRDKDRAYFLTMTVVGWIDLFTRSNHKLLLLKSLKFCQDQKGLEIYGYCIMPSHLHLIAKAVGDYTLSEILRDFKKFTSKKLIEQIIDEPESRKDWLLNYFAFEASQIKRNKNYKIWQDGNQPKEIFSNNFFWEKLNYIHLNPVKDLIVEHAEDYLFCSARNYADLDSYLDIVLESSKTITYK